MSIYIDVILFNFWLSLAGLAIPTPPQNDQGNNESDDESLSEGLTELMFQPPDPSVIQRMYTAMNECQALHPDPNDSDDSEEIDEDEEFGKFYTYKFFIL